MEAVYRICGLCLKHCTRSIVFIPTDINSTRYLTIHVLILNFNFLICHSTSFFLTENTLYFANNMFFPFSHPFSSCLPRLSLPIKVLKSREKGSTDIWCTNIVDRYLARPDGPPFDEMCLAEFCAQFRISAATSSSKERKEPDCDDDMDAIGKSFILKKGLGQIHQRLPSTTLTPHATQFCIPINSLQSLIQ